MFLFYISALFVIVSGVLALAAQSTGRRASAWVLLVAFVLWLALAAVFYWGGFG